jgi:integrase
VKACVLRMREAGLKPSSVNCRLRAIAAYVKWAALNVAVPRLREEKRELPTFSADALGRLLKWKPRTPAQHRLSAAIALLFDSGCRIDECLSLQWSDIDFDNLLVTLHGKGRKDRKVPRQGPGPLPLARLPTQQPHQGHAPRCGRVPAPLFTARITCGFVKIRHFGLLANRNRRRALTLCRQYLNSAEPESAALLTPQQVAALHRCCPNCHCGTLRIVARLSASMIATCAATHRTINSS